MLFGTNKSSQLEHTSLVELPAFSENRLEGDVLSLSVLIGLPLCLLGLALRCLCFGL